MIRLTCSNRDAGFSSLSDHASELSERLVGSWIAVRDGEVVGIGKTVVEAADQARAKAEDGEFILEAVDAEVDVIYGCS